MKKTRKIRNKKLFLKWLKKSHKNNYNRVHSGGVVKKTKILETPSENDVKTIEDEELEVKKLGAAGVGMVALGQVDTLMEMAYSLASNDAVVSVISGIGDSLLRVASSETMRNTIMVLATGTAVGTAMASCGVAVIVLAIGLAAAVKLKERFAQYHVFIQSINNYILLLRKIDIMIKVAMRISAEYKFIIDTKDVVRALEFILNLFEDLITAGDVKDIKNKLVSGTFSTGRVLDEQFKEINDSDEGVGDVAYDDDDTTSNSESQMLIPKDAVNAVKGKENFLKRMGTSISSKYQSISSKYQSLKTEINRRGTKLMNRTVNQNKLSKKIDKGVTKLGLYFAVLLGEMNIILNVCQMGLICDDDKGTISTANNSVKNEIHFKKMLVSSMIYRTLQLRNIFDTCEATKSGTQVKEIKEMCSPSKKQEHVEEVEIERDKIYNVFFSKQFPLYASQITAKSINTKDPLSALKNVMNNFKSKINTVEEANAFLKAIYEFDEEN